MTPGRYQGVKTWARGRKPKALSERGKTPIIDVTEVIMKSPTRRPVRLPAKFNDYAFAASEMTVFDKIEKHGSPLREEHSPVKRGRGRPRKSGLSKLTSPCVTVSNQKQQVYNHFGITDEGNVIFIPAANQFQQKEVAEINCENISEKIYVSNVSYCASVNVIDGKETVPNVQSGNGESEFDYQRYQDEMLSLAASQQELHEVTTQNLDVSLERRHQDDTISSLRKAVKDYGKQKQLKPTFPEPNREVRVSSSSNILDISKPARMLIVQPSQKIQDLCRRTLENLQNGKKLSASIKQSEYVTLKNIPNIKTKPEDVPVSIQNINQSVNEFSDNLNTDKLESTFDPLQFPNIIRDEITVSDSAESQSVQESFGDPEISSQSFAPLSSNEKTQIDSTPQNINGNTQMTSINAESSINTNQPIYANFSCDSRKGPLIQENGEKPRKKVSSTEEMILQIANDILFDDENTPVERESIQQSHETQISEQILCDDTNLQTLVDAANQAQQRVTTMVPSAKVDSVQFVKHNKIFPLCDSSVTTVAGNKAVLSYGVVGAACTFELYGSEKQVTNIKSHKTVVVYPREPARGKTKKQPNTEEKVGPPKKRKKNEETRKSITAKYGKPSSTNNANQQSVIISGQFEPVYFDVTTDETQVISQTDTGHTLNQIDSSQLESTFTVIEPDSQIQSNYQSENQSVVEYVTESGETAEICHVLQENGVSIEQGFIPVLNQDTNSGEVLYISEGNLQYVLLDSSVSGDSRYQLQAIDPEGLMHETQYIMTSPSQEQQYIVQTTEGETIQYSASETENVTLDQVEQGC